MDIPSTLVVVMACRVCHFETLCQGGLCLDCRNFVLDSQTCRAWCDLIHRDSPARRADREAGHVGPVLR